MSASKVVFIIDLTFKRVVTDPDGTTATVLYDQALVFKSESYKETEDMFARVVERIIDSSL